MRTITLINVDPYANHNKFYRLTEQPGGTVRAEYGRIGSRGQSITYSGHNVYDQKWYEKQTKGYVEADLSADKVVRARRLLADIESGLANGTVDQRTKAAYLTIVPQPVREVADNSWVTRAWIAAQRQLLDTLGMVAGLAVA